MVMSVTAVMAGVMGMSVTAVMVGVMGTLVTRQIKPCFVQSNLH
jgi:hypothetical protein